MIFKFEKRVLDFFINNLFYLVFISAFIISALIRISLRNFTTDDATVYLLPWYDSIKSNGGIFGLSTPIEGCNYNFPYQFLIAIMTYLPIKPLFAYKFLSCLFDYLLSAVVAYFVYDISTTNKTTNCLLAFIITCCSPLVIINSSAWAQCDSIYCFWIILSLFFLMKEKYFKSFIFLGIAFSFKFQAIFILPFFLFYYFYKRRISLLYFLLIPFSMIVLSLPALLQGRSIVEMITIYTDNTNAHPSLTNNYPTFWRILNDGTNSEGYLALKYFTILFTIIVLGIFVFTWVSSNVETSPANIIFMAFLFSYSSIFFLPSMHERYGYLYEILAIIIVFIYPKTIPLLVSLTCLSLTTYGIFLFGNTVNEWLMSVINTIIYLSYVLMLNKKIIRKEA